jgi:mannose-6-phosphate isomerase-like protein (cupin superfamily)
VQFLALANRDCRADNSRMTSEPISLDDVFATFTDQWSPRIVTNVNDYDVRVARVHGEHVWHVHDDTDEFFLVLDGELQIGLREAQGERTVTLRSGQVFTVPRGTEHKPRATAPTRILLLEPSGTSTVGDRHETVPDHVDVTTGHRVS